MRKIYQLLQVEQQLQNNANTVSKLLLAAKPLDTWAENQSKTACSAIQSRTIFIASQYVYMFTKSLVYKEVNTLIIVFGFTPNRQ